MSYEEARNRYAWDEMSEKWFQALTRRGDFDLLDYEIEGLEDKPSVEQVERILDRFNQSLVDDDDYHFYKVGHLRDAICDVMGAGYLER